MGMMGGGSGAGFILRLVLAFAIAAIGYVYFGAVLPRPAATGLALFLAAIELFGPMLGGRAGISLLTLAKLGIGVLMWPGVAWLIVWTGYVPDPIARVALAAAVASAIGIFAAGHGQGHEHARLLAVIVSLALPAYAVTLALFDPSPLGVAAACLAVGVGVMVARLAWVWPRRHEELMLTGAGVAFAAAAAMVIVVIL